MHLTPIRRFSPTKSTRATNSFSYHDPSAATAHAGRHSPTQQGDVTPAVARSSTRRPASPPRPRAAPQLPADGGVSLRAWPQAPWQTPAVSTPFPAVLTPPGAHVIDDDDAYAVADHREEEEEEEVEPAIVAPVIPRRTGRVPRAARRGPSPLQQAEVDLEREVAEAMSPLPLVWSRDAAPVRRRSPSPAPIKPIRAPSPSPAASRPRSAPRTRTPKPSSHRRTSSSSPERRRWDTADYSPSSSQPPRVLRAGANRTTRAVQAAAPSTPVRAADYLPVLILQSPLCES